MAADVGTMAPPEIGAQERPRPVSQSASGSGVALLGSAGAAFAITWIVLRGILPASGTAGFVLGWYALFLLIYYLVEHELEGPLIAGDRFASVVVTTGGLLLLTPLVFIIGFVVEKGYHALSLHFFTQTQATTGPSSPYTQGGVAHAIVGTLEQVGLAVLISVPLGFLCAIFMNEVGGRLKRPVRTFVDAMSGVPTIVAGIFIYAVWILGLHHDFSGFAACLAISISMLPVITRTSVEVLRLVPDGLRESSLAMGISEWRTVRGVVLPTARPGLITAVILGVARAIGETAPLIMTAFGAYVMNANPFSGPQAGLPLFVYAGLRSTSENDVQRAWTGALVLILLVLTLFTIARVWGARAARGGRLRRAPERFR